MESFGKYQLIRRLGSGGMAEVHLAREPLAQGLNKILVIKKIHPSLADEAQFRQMFEDEARVAVNLNHPNVVQTFGYGQIGKTFYLSMELVEGVDLLRLMNSAAQLGERVPIGLAAYIVQQVAKGLDYAHRKTDEYGEPLNIVHRDISPQNILVSFDGSVKIVDFGIARSRHAKDDEGVVKGKFAYMSPEQAAGEPVDLRADVFSTGVVLWELVCARSLFGHLKGKQALDTIRAGNVLSPRAIDPTVPVALEAIVMKALQRRPENRYTTARDLHRALGQFFFELSSQLREGQIFDSGALAAFVSRVVPKETRIVDTQPRPGLGDRPGALAESQLLLVGEQRQIVLVTANLSGVAALRRHHPSDFVERTLKALDERIAELVKRHGAQVERQDDRGATFMFGVPITSEDDAARALRLSIDLLDAVAALSRNLEPPLRLALGVSIGACLIMRNLAEEGKPYDAQVAANATQLVNRLAGEAIGGEILVSDRVFRAARRDFRFEELGAVAVGETQDGSLPVVDQTKTYRLIGARQRHEPHQFRPSAIVGRQRELAELAAIHASLIAQPRAAHVLILGDAGVGKRTLVEAFRRTLDPEKHLVLRAAARPQRRDVAYSMVADLARDFLGVHEDSDPREVRRRVHGAISALFKPDESGADATADALLLLLGQPIALADDLDPAERRQRLHLAIRELHKRVADERLLLVVLEDFQWADEPSFDIFTALVREPVERPLLALVTARHDERIEQLNRSPRLQKILVGELDAEAREALVAERFASRADAAALAPRVLEQAGGNPFFIEEILESLLECGVLTPGGLDELGRPRLKWARRDEPITVPSSLEAVVTSRIDRLPTEDRDVLRRAALWGRSFSVDDIAALSDGDRRESLQRLAARGLIVATTETNDALGPLHFEFRNLITKEIAYAGLGPDARALLHSVAADRLVRSPNYRRGLDDTQLAEHLSAAGDGLAAGEALLRAAQFARETAGGIEALRLLDRAIELLPQDAYEERYRTHSEREVLFRGFGDRVAQQREAQAMLQTAIELHDRRRESESHARLSLFYLESGKYPAARREIDRALRLARESGQALAESEALRIEALVLSSIGRNSEARERARRAIDVLPAATSTDDTASYDIDTQRANALNALGMITLQIGNLADADAAYQEALQIHSQRGQRRLEAATLNNMGWVAVGLGRYEDALLHYKRSLKIAQELGDRLGIGIRLANLGQTCGELGDLERARKYLDKAIELQQAIGDVGGMADALISRAQVSLRQRRWDDANVDLERGIEHATQTRNRYQEVRALIYQAQCRLLSGRSIDAAIELAHSAHRLALEASIANGEAYGLGVEAIAKLAADRPHEAFELASAAVAIFDNGRAVDAPEEILLWHARCANAAGHRSDAQTSIRRAAAMVQEKADRLSDPMWKNRYLQHSPQAEIFLLQAELDQ